MCVGYAMKQSDDDYILTEKTLTLTKAIEQALSMEAAERNAKSFSGNESSIKKL